MSDPLGNIENIIMSLFHASNAMLSNAVLIGMWLLIDRVSPLLKNLLNQVIPPEIISMTEEPAKLFVKMFLFKYLVQV